jgi:SPRY domain
MNFLVNPHRFVAASPPAWSPSAIPLCAWYDASAAANVSLTGSLVDQWNDLSGNGNHLTAAGVARPTYDTTTLAIDAKAVISFPSTVNAFFGKSNIVGFPANNDSPVTVVSLFHASDLNNRGFVDFTDTALLTNTTGLLLSTGGNMLLRVGDGTLPATVPFTEIAAPHIWSALHDNSNRQLRVDGGTPNIEATALAIYNYVHMRVGMLFQDAFPMRGEFAELVIFPGSSATDREKAEGYLAHKWGLEGNLPAGHPYKTTPPGPTSYVAWDPATVASVTLSSGNLVATNTGTTSTNQGAHVSASAEKTAGKYYFEVTLTTLPDTSANSRCVGVGTSASTYSGIAGGTTGTIWLPLQATNNIRSNGAAAGNVTDYGAVGSVIGVAVDLDNRKIWFRNSGRDWNNNATHNPTTNVGGFAVPAGAMVPFITFGGTFGVAGNVFTAKFGTTAFSGTVPSGFTAGWPAEVYTAWNPASVTNVTLSGGNLIAAHSNTTTNSGARSAAQKNSGKHYFEITVNNWGAGDDIGVVTPAGTYTNVVSNGTNGAYVYMSSGNIWNDAGLTGLSIGAVGVGNVIGVAVDLDNEKIWFRKAPAGNWNGQVIGSQNPATNTGGASLSTVSATTVSPVVGFGSSALGNVTANFGASAFTGTVPSGFIAGWLS